ncbi:protein no-on-transient A isoform X2 [Venturia canescens]|uniref:protein no-on-transient A isoform X2 n=1 Tax=Venturia canescens TaxID=32260 RepID=UPI001C9C3C6D|nr:protein no-on-transient A isoform X2 [Venturia canescens]
MKFATTLILAAFTVALVSTVPVPDNQSLRSQVLERLVMVEGDNEEALRSKRTIGILRQLFPQLSEIVERKVNAITSEVIKVLGPVILQSVLGGGARRGGGGGRSGGGTSDGTTVEAASPFDDDKKSEQVSGSSGGDKLSSTSKSGSRISISLPTFPPDEEDAGATESPASRTTIRSSTERASSSTANQEAEDRLAEETAESQNNEVRVQFADEQANEAGGSELAPLEDVEVSDDENRNKRFLNFGFGASGGAGGAGAGGSGGGSGNFLFDIIRLVAGSGSSQQGDVAAGAPSPGRNDGTTEAVPGPVTRLFVIANRGISNLIQDLILRLAATSERIVNFKARLITSII